MIIALFSNISKVDSKTLSVGVREFLTKHGITVIAPDDYAPVIGAEPISGVENEDINFLISVGGDGTILRVLHCYPELNDIAPIFAINKGSFGFMADNCASDVFSNLLELIKGKFSVEERLVLEGKTANSDICFAVNEMAIHRAQNPSLIDLSVHLDGKYVNTFAADGLIIATPNGSTAYSLAAGGPIICPDLDACVITPICPHTISNRPLVFTPSKEIQIQYLSSHDPVEITFDGISRFHLNSGETFTIKKSEKKFRLVDISCHDYFATLREKLNWSGKLR